MSNEESIALLAMVTKMIVDATPAMVTIVITVDLFVFWRF